MLYYFQEKTPDENFHCMAERKRPLPQKIGGSTHTRNRNTEATADRQPLTSLPAEKLEYGDDG